MSSLKRSARYMACMLLALCSSVYGHTYLSSVYLNNQALNEGDCVRPHPSTAFDSPIPLVTAADMTCGWLPQAATAANRKCPISAGSSIGIQWHHNSNAASDNIIDATHKGPVIVYMAKSDTGSGNVWFKIYEDGYVNGAWGVDRLLSNGGRVDVTIPSDIASGNYLLRGEVIALHSAYDLNGVQPYVGCVELTVSGSGSANPTGVALPGYYKATDPGMLINIYNTVTDYVIPGPAVYTSGSSSGSGSGSGSSTSAPATSAPATSSPTRTPATSSPTRTPATSSPTRTPATSSPTKTPATSSPTKTPATSSPTKTPATSSPTKSPTSRPPTSATSRPTSSATSAPVSTSSPISTTSPSNGNGEDLTLQVNGGSNIWWFAVDVSGGSEDTVKVELADSGAVSNFYIMSKASYGWYFSQSIQLTLPISLRFTSASGKQVVVEKYISSFTDSSVKETKLNYGSSASATSAPTNAATQPASTQAPSNGNQQITLSKHTGSSAWWFAVSVSGVDADQISKVELKDSDSVSSYKSFEATTWGYYIFPTAGTPLVAPISVRVTTSSGSQSTVSYSSV